MISNATVKEVADVIRNLIQEKIAAEVKGGNVFYTNGRNTGFKIQRSMRVSSALR